MDKTMYCSQISDFISSVIIYLCGFVFFFKTYLNRKIFANAEKRAALTAAGAQKDARGTKEGM